MNGDMKLASIQAAEKKLMLNTYERNPVLLVGGGGVFLRDDRARPGNDVSRRLLEHRARRLLIGSFVRTKGLEPLRQLRRQNLNLVRLPIPPRSRVGSAREVLPGRRFVKDRRRPPAGSV